MKIMNLSTTPKFPCAFLFSLSPASHSYFLQAPWLPHRQALNCSMSFLDYFAFSRILCKWNYSICISFLLSLSTIILQFIHAVMCIYLFCLSSISLYGHATIPLFISPGNGQLGCFQFLAIANNAAMNISVQIFI